MNGKNQLVKAPATAASQITNARIRFHSSLLQGALTVENGVPAIADKSSRASIAISAGVVDRIGSAVEAAKASGQTAGKDFEEACQEFLSNTFLRLAHLRPGTWSIERGLALARFEQFEYLGALARAAGEYPELRAVLQSDYTIAPDVVVIRHPESDAAINQSDNIVDDSTARFAVLRQKNGAAALLHASIPCKWTLRSDRAQNARTEALNLIRLRKGRVPHITVVTAEPLPSRLASLAYGTGDIDCVYHFALQELVETLESLGDREDQLEMLRTMIAGKRLRDISDLPLDLAV